MKCPKCKSNECFPITETETKGVDIVSSFCGYAVFGPVGLLCGLCDAGNQKSKQYWKCGNCGTCFK